MTNDEVEHMLQEAVRSVIIGCFTDKMYQCFEVVKSQTRDEKELRKLSKAIRDIEIIIHKRKKSDYEKNDIKARWHKRKIERSIRSLENNQPTDKRKKI